MQTNLRIRAFRATEDFESCVKFYEGHKKVLENHGITKVTSSNNEWMQSDSVFVVVVETLDGEKLYGGVRIHVSSNTSGPLPIQSATGKLDPKIHDVVKQYAQYGAGELCGLWNSKEVAGYGIGSIFPIRAATSITNQIGLKSLFFLCSPATLRFNEWIGSRVIAEVGNNGSFYYPKLDLIATAVVLEDTINLPAAQPREKNKIRLLRENPKLVGQEKSPFKNLLLDVHYNLKLGNANPLEFVQFKQEVAEDKVYTAI